MGNPGALSGSGEGAPARWFVPTAVAERFALEASLASCVWRRGNYWSHVSLLLESSRRKGSRIGTGCGGLSVADLHGNRVRGLHVQFSDLADCLVEFHLCQS